MHHDVGHTGCGHVLNHPCIYPVALTLAWGRRFATREPHWPGATARSMKRACSNGILLHAIGHDGVAIFKRFYDDLRPETPSWHGCAMTGNFESLPTELCQCIVTRLLTSDVAREWQDVHHFLLTCRGAAAAVTRAHRFEAAARIYMLGALRPLPLVPVHRAYTELFYCFVRSHVALKSMVDTFEVTATHCADQACCQQSREDANARWRQKDWWNSWGRVGSAIVHEALGEEHPVVQISVAASKNAYPLCYTDRGVAIVQHGHADGAKGVLCVERERCDIFSPDRDLKVSFEVPTRDFVYLAASSGTLLAIIVLAALEDDNIPIDLYADEVAFRSSDNGVLQVWDMASGERLFETEVEAVVHELWLFADTVFCCMQSLQREEPNLWPLRVERFLARRTNVPKAIHLLGLCCVIRDTCVARHTGDLAVLDSRDDFIEMRERLIFYDAARAQTRVIDSYDRVHEGRRSLVRISPMGDTLVMLRRSDAKHRLIIYRRKERADVGECPNLGWVCWKHIEPHCGFPNTLSYKYIQCAFSPCGGKMLYFCRDGGGLGGEVILVDLRAMFKGQERALTTMPMLHAAIPHDVFAWNDGGLYLPTGSRGGILCIGA
ncbi:MAG: hypothetical protein CMI29_08295 [Opitutae bacterium]|nr:hypothetical protein [Opitutae bacterium]